MLKRIIFISIFGLLFGQNAECQIPESISINFLKKEIEVLPGQITNIPFAVKNNSNQPFQFIPEISTPDKINAITILPLSEIKPSEQKINIYTLQIPSNFPVGLYKVSVNILNAETRDTVAMNYTNIKVGEVENITMQMVELPANIIAGESFSASFLLQNFGNTSKKVVMETFNCDNINNSEVSLKPGESATITVSKKTSPDLPEAKQEFFRVRAHVSGEVVKSMYRSVMVFPAKNRKKDLYYRFPVSMSATYLSTNQQNNFESAYQFELYGSGNLDPAGKHQLEFLARGPNSSNLSFLGLYDQYYISYSNKNLDLFVGEKSYAFTPLTESSRFGLGVESRIKLNNGISFGFLYVKPRFYENISDELAVYTGFEKNRYNSVDVYYVMKREEQTNDLTLLGSISSKFRPLEKTSVEIEYSRGEYHNIADNAFRTNINTQFSIFSLSGNYIYTGKNYPGYYSNSRFYSGSFSMNITQKMSLGMYARQDFSNAQLDTFFVTAPFSKSIQTIWNYNIAPRTYLKIYWKEYEKKDRLALDKFHYKTKSLNSQFRRKLTKFEYILQAEYGKTTNYLQETLKNKQTSYRASANLSYRFNSNHAVRAFTSWSNINSFVSSDQRNLTAGLSISSQIGRNLKANFHIQNAYDIDDYYRNRNLMQLNLDYNFWKNHNISLRSFYTIFKQQTDNPEFTLAATYTYDIGVPVKQVLKAGELTGRIVNIDDEPANGIVLRLLNKSVITNKNGEFTFKSIPPGIHLLTVDRSNFEIDEITNIPNPTEIEIIEDLETTINLRIVKGAKIEGNFFAIQNNNSDEKIRIRNIILELKNEFEQFRITSDAGGNFSFPLIRPGEWELKIYTNSIPSGFNIDHSSFIFNLNSGEKKNLSIELKPKKRNIIFKSQGISVSNSEGVNSKPITLSSSQEKQINQNNDSVFYSIQIGAFRKRVKTNSRFFKGEQFDFEKEINNLNKYYIGRFETYDEALEEKGRLATKFRGAFIVVFKNDQLIYLINSKNE